MTDLGLTGREDSNFKKISGSLGGEFRTNWLGNLKICYFTRGRKLALVFTLVVVRILLFHSCGFSLRTVSSP